MRLTVSQCRQSFLNFVRRGVSSDYDFLCEARRSFVNWRIVFRINGVTAKSLDTLVVERR
jgi:hypothetical protein